MARPRKSGSLIIAIVLGFTQQLSAQSMQLTQPTIDSFNTYVSQAEARMQADIRAGQLFWIDDLTGSGRKQSHDRLRAGEVVIERVAGEGHIPGGLIHHWKGLAFFPGVPLAAAVQLLQSYGRYQTIYAPTVTASRLKQHNGNTFDV